MRFSYDAEVDILMVYLAEDVKARRSQGDHLPFGGAYADLADDGTILALEIQDASKKYPVEMLKAHPARYDVPISLADAAAVAGITAIALRKAVERQRLTAIKVGNSWTTTIAELHVYLNSRAHEGANAEMPKAAARIEPAPSATSQLIPHPRRPRAR
ncbi:MAG: hypothetical protein JWM80_1259 [Cyanobacteria bacterium RYN_339]|nr:hypothetical protein [Cyanobacteria bacterium RYN_339]